MPTDREDQGDGSKVPFWAANAKRREEDADALLTARRRQMHRSLELGLPVWVYKTSYIEVDYQMGEGPPNDPVGLNIRELNEAGWSGWEVVAVIPRTYSGTRAYTERHVTTLQEFGGRRSQHEMAMSGNVIGVYVLQRLRISMESLEGLGDELDRLILGDLRD